MRPASYSGVPAWFESTPAPHKARYKTTSPGRKLLKGKGEWVAMREGQLTAVPSVRAESCGLCSCKKKVTFFLAG